MVIDITDNASLMESCIDEQVLQEMNFSKKDLQDPATIDKILNRKDVFYDVIKYTAFLFSALNFAAGIVVKVKLDKADIGGSGGIGAGTVLLLELILVKIHGLVKDIPAKQYVKNIDKYKKQVQDLITKMEEKKKSDPDNADKYQKVIDNCKSVLAEFDRRDKEAKNKALQDKVDVIESLYYDLRDWWNTKDTIFGHTGNGNDYDAFQIAQAYSMQESTIIDKFIENATRSYTIMKPDDYYCIIGNENVEKARKEFHDSDLIVMSSDDEDTKFIVKNTKRVYETDCDTYWSSKVYKFREKIDQEGLKEFDKIHGFYKFSKCPDAVKQKDFLEELNKKSSVKENADMVIDVNPIPVNEETSEIKESVETSITEGFGIDKSQKASLSDLELSYDRKFNAFCLSVSSYSPEKLRNTLIQKQNALADAQKEKKEAKDRYAKLAAQLKIDYLRNAIEKTNTLIKKKSKAVASAAPKKKAVSESVEVLNELFGKKWKAGKEAKSEPPKPTEPRRKYANLTKEEFDKCMSIIKNTTSKYPKIKKVMNYESNGCYSTYQKYIDFDEDDVVVAFLEWDQYDSEIKDEDKLDKFLKELDKDMDECYKTISEEFGKLDFDVKFDAVPDAQFDCLCINSRKKSESDKKDES